MHKKEPQEPPKHTSEHVKSLKISWGCAPSPPLHNPFWEPPLFVLPLGLPNPLGGPGYCSGGSRILKRGACIWSLYLTKLDKAREARQRGVWGHAALEIFLISDLRSFLVPFLGDIARV